MRTWRRKPCPAAHLLSIPQSPNMNEASGGGVWIFEGAECAHFKENRRHEKDRNHVYCACHDSCELRGSVRAKACTQIRAGDDRTGSDKTEHRKDAATGTGDKCADERPGNFTFAGCG